MPTYTPQIFPIPNGLDELGIELGLKRLPQESLRDYRRRLLLEARDPAGASEKDFIRSLNRQVGLFEQPVFEISLAVDGNDEPLASDPFIEVTSCFLRAYHNYEDSELDFELNIVDRSAAYFLRDVYAAFVTSTYFNAAILYDDYTYLKSDHLRFSNTNKLSVGSLLLQSRVNKLLHQNVKKIYPSSATYFLNEKASTAELTVTGDFYVDYLQGIIFTYESAAGFISYEWRAFPYTMYWQPVRAMPLNDEDIKEILYDTLISDATGLPERLVLGTYGATIIDELLTVHPLQWGF